MPCFPHLENGMIVVFSIYLIKSLEELNVFMSRKCLRQWLTSREHSLHMGIDLNYAEVLVFSSCPVIFAVARAWLAPCEAWSMCRRSGNT